MFNEVNYQQCEDFILNSMYSHRPGCILGSPGIGKTTLPRGVAKRLSIGYMELRGELVDAIDLRGLLVPDPATGLTTSYALDKWPLQRLADQGLIPQRGILCIDDMLNSERSVINGLSEPILEHTINGLPLAEGWSIMVTGNHIGGGTSAKPLPTQVVGRLHFVTLIPDWEGWAKWANGIISDELVGYFEMQKGQDLFLYDPAVRMEKPNEPWLSPRSLHGLSDRVKAHREFVGGKPQLYLYASAVGEYGSKLYATLEYLPELCSWEDLVQKPGEAKVPKSPGAKFAQLNIILSGVKHLAKQEDPAAKIARVQGAVGDYVRRMSAEVAAAVHSRIVGSVPIWADTPAFVKWIQANRAPI